MVSRSDLRFLTAKTYARRRSQVTGPVQDPRSDAPCEMTMGVCLILRARGPVKGVVLLFQPFRSVVGPCSRSVAVRAKGRLGEGRLGERLGTQKRLPQVGKLIDLLSRERLGSGGGEANADTAETTTPNVPGLTDSEAGPASAI